MASEDAHEKEKGTESALLTLQSSSFQGSERKDTPYYRLVKPHTAGGQDK